MRVEYRGSTLILNKEIAMAQLWYKFEKRIKRVSEDASSDEINKLKAEGYVQVTDRSDPENSKVLTKNKTQLKAKPKTKPKAKAKKK